MEEDFKVSHLMDETPSKVKRLQNYYLIISKRFDELYDHWAFYLFLSILTIVCFSLTAVRKSFFKDFSQVEGMMIVSVSWASVVIPLGIIFLSDLSLLFTPLLLWSLSAMNASDVSVSTYYHLIPQSIILMLAIAFRLFHGTFISKRKWVKGDQFYEMLFVCLAVLLGGLGFAEKQEYKSMVGLSFYIALGPMAFIVYWLLVNNINRGNRVNALDVINKGSVIVGLVSFAIIIASLIMVSEEYLHDYIIDNGYGTFENLKLHQNVLKLIMKSPLYFDWKNTLSQLILFCIPGTLMCALGKKKGWIYYIFAVLFAVGSIMTKSRNGQILGILLFVIVSIIFFKKRKDNQKYVAVFVFIIAFIIMLITIIFISYNIESFKGKLNTFVSDNARTSLYKNSLIDFIMHPFFGVGIQYVPSDPVFNVKLSGIYWRHNSLLQVLACLGLFGLMAYALLVKKRFKILCGNNRTYNQMGIFYYIIYLFLGVFDIIGFSPQPSGIMFIIILVVIENQNKKERQKLILMEEEEFKYLA